MVAISVFKVFETSSKEKRDVIDYAVASAFLKIGNSFNDHLSLHHRNTHSQEQPGAGA